MVMRLRDLPNPQAYTREERYRARPPFVMDQSGFHNENSLAVYQGLVYYLLWLHSKYDKVGTWRLAGYLGPGWCPGLHGAGWSRGQGLCSGAHGTGSGTGRLDLGPD